MKLLSLTCQHCAAPLEVPAKITQVTCQFCGTRLKVQRTGSAAYTESLEEVAQQVARVADNTDQLKLEQEIARLDRDWMLSREQYMVRGKNGQLNVPTRASAAVAGVIIVVFGVFWTMMATGIAGAVGFSLHLVGGGAFGLIAGFVPCFGILFITLGIVTAVTGYREAGAFEHGQAEYQARRNALLAELNRAGSQSRRTMPPGSPAAPR